jgi:hypothetical protein
MKKATELTTMATLGKWNPTENCFLTTYHPSFMVCWWVLVHSGPLLFGIKLCIKLTNFVDGQGLQRGALQE